METIFTVRGKPVRLGRLAKDPAQKVLKLAQYVNFSQLPPLPAAWDWLAQIADWPMAVNDQLGCCVTSSDVHQLQVFSKYSDLSETIVPDAEVKRYYLAQTGGRDNGLNIGASLKYWTTHAFGGTKLLGAAAIEPISPPSLRQAIKLFGGVKLGVNLPGNFLDEINAGKPWANTRYPADARNGHAIPLVAFDANFATCITWGIAQKCSWAWIAKYCDEAYALVHPTWVDKNLPPAGVDMVRLRADFNELTGADVPNWPDPDFPPPGPPNPVPPSIQATLQVVTGLPPGNYSLGYALRLEPELGGRVMELLRQAQNAGLTPAQWAMLLQMIQILIDLFAGGNTPPPPAQTEEYGSHAGAGPV